MQVYRVTPEKSPSLATYAKTRADAHAVAKTNRACDPIIDLIEVPTDAASLVDYLNGQRPADAKILRSWDLTPRGGLRDITEPTSAGGDALV